MEETHLDALLQSALTGGRKEAEAFLREVRPLVCRWALIWTGSPDAAEDLAQRVLIKVHRSMRTYRPGRVEAWVYRIGRNAFLDWERQQGSEHRLRERLQLNQLAEQVAERDAIAPVFVAQLLGLMKDLSPRQRMVLDLVDFQGFEPSEAAELLDLAPQTVRVHLHRARRLLRIACSDPEPSPAPREVKNG